MSEYDFTKFPEESRVFGFDFALQPELTSSPAETLTGTPTITATRIKGAAAETLAISAAQVSGSKARALFASGNLGDVHDIRCTVTTSAGRILAARGTLIIERR